MELTHLRHSAVQFVQDWIAYLVQWLRDFLLPEISKSIVIIEEAYENIRENIQSSFIGRVLSIPLPVLTAFYLIMNNKSKQIVGVCILLWYWYHSI
jgi:hypothetical protein